jgi:hypothetical protein
MSVVLLVSGCSHGTPPALAQAVLRRQLPDWPSEFLLCVSVDGADADMGLLADIRKENRAAVAGSECKYDLSGSYHRASGRKAVLMNVTQDSRHEVRFEARHAGKWGEFLTFEVQQSDSGWRIVRVLKHEAA